jgi:Ran GTPase-activating protein (RanGAP) involved in mRNA processing and transport
MVPICQLLIESRVLENLDISNNGVTDAGCLQLELTFKTLTKSEEGDTLKSLIMLSNPMTKKGKRALANSLIPREQSQLEFFACDSLQVLPENRRYDLSGNIDITDVMMLAGVLKGNSKITLLNVSGGKLNPNAISALGKSIMDNDRSGVEFVVTQAFSVDKDTTDLDLSTAAISIDDVIFLSAALKSNSTLTTLTVPTNLERGKNSAVLLKAMTMNVGLRSLNGMCVDDEETSDFSLGKFQGLQDYEQAWVGRRLEINKALTTNLILAGNNITGQELMKYKACLEANEVVTYLDLSNNPLGLEGAEIMSDVLRVNKTLRFIQMKKADLDGKGKKALGQALIDSPESQMTWFAADQWSFLPGTEGVDLGNRGITSDDLILMAGLLKRNQQLTWISLTKNPVCAKISMMDRVIGGDRFYETGIAAFFHSLRTSHSRITKLNMSQCALTTKALKSLAQLMEGKKCPLKWLDLRRVDVAVDGAQILANGLKENRTLKFLGFAESEIPLDSLYPKEKRGCCCTPFELDMSKNNLKIGGAFVMSALLPRSPSITKLNFSDNGMQPQSLPPIAEMLRNTMTITDLDLSHNSAGVHWRTNESQTEGVAAIIHALRFHTGITHLNFSSMTFVGCAIPAFSYGPMNQMLKAFRLNQTVASINLSGNFLNAEAIQLLVEALMFNQTLSYLDLKQNNITNEGALSIGSLLSRHKGLTRLDISACRLCSDDTGPTSTSSLSGVLLIAKSLMAETSVVRYLNLKDNGISDAAGNLAEAMEEMQRSGKRVRKKMKEDTDDDDQDHALLALGQNLTQATSLETVIFNTYPYHLKTLLGLDQAELLDFSNLDLGLEEIVVVTSIIVCNKHVKTIDLRGNELGPLEMKILGAALRDSTDCNIENIYCDRWCIDQRTLALQYKSKRFSEDDMVLLSALFKTNTKIRNVDLADNHIVGLIPPLNRGAYSLVGLKAFFHCLHYNKTLTNLNIRDNQLGSKGLNLLAFALDKNRTLTKINAAGNAVNMNIEHPDHQTEDHHGVEMLMKVMASNQMVTDLDISDNGLMLPDFTFIATMLPENNTLQKFFIQRTPIGIASGKVLADALTRNYTMKWMGIGYMEKQLDMVQIRDDIIEELHLPMAQLTPGGCVIMMSLATFSANLMCLNLAGNNMGVQAALTAADLLLNHKTLMTLDLSMNAICGVEYDYEASKWTGRFTLSSVIAIVQACRANRIERQVVLMQNGVSAEYIDELRKEFAGTFYFDREPVGHTSYPDIPGMGV